MAEPVTLVVRLRAKTRREAALRQTLLEIRAASLQETGCLLYDVHQSTEDPAVFLLYQVWASQAAADAHTKASHVHGFLLSARQYLLDRPRVTWWRRLEDAQRAAGRYL